VLYGAFGFHYSVMLTELLNAMAMALLLVRLLQDFAHFQPMNFWTYPYRQKRASQWIKGVRVTAG